MAVRSTIEVIRPSAKDELAFSRAAPRPPSISAGSVDYSRVIVRKPWGYEYLLFSNDSVAVWVLYIKAGEETSMHCHARKKTSLIVLDGIVRCSTLDVCLRRRAGEGL